MDQQWYYVRNGKSLGPVSVSELRHLVAQGELRPDDLVWREGMAEWSSVASMELTPPAVIPPPIPVARPTTPRHEFRQRQNRSPTNRPVIVWSVAGILAVLLCVGWVIASLSQSDRESIANDRAAKVKRAKDRVEKKHIVAANPQTHNESSSKSLDPIAVETTTDARQSPMPEEKKTPVPPVVANTPNNTSSDARAPATQQPAVALHANQTLFQIVDIQRSPSFSIQGLETKQSLHYQVLSRLEVETIAEPRATKVVQSVQDTRLVAADDGSREGFLKALDNLKLHQYTYRLNHRGEVIEFTGHKESRVAIPLDLASATGFQLTSVIDEDGWKELAELTFLTPPRDQRVGEPWKRQMTHDWGALGSWSGITTFAPQPPQEQLSQITFTREMRYAAPRSTTVGLPFQIRSAAFKVQQASGAIAFDIAGQRVRNARENFAVSGTVTAELAGVGVEIGLTEQQILHITLSEHRLSL